MGSDYQLKYKFEKYVVLLKNFQNTGYKEALTKQKEILNFKGRFPHSPFLSQKCASDPEKVRFLSQVHDVPQTAERI